MKKPKPLSKATSPKHGGHAEMRRHDSMFGKTAKKTEDDDKTLKKGPTAQKRARAKRLTQTVL
jgi:hypothetical protein